MLKRKKHKYKEYDYEEAYKVQVETLNEYFIEEMLRNRTGGYVYATKEITAGNQFEVEIYPEFFRSKDIPVKDKKNSKGSSTAQRNFNDKKSRKEFERTLNTNFKAGDLWITFTYDDAHYPESIEKAIKDMTNYIRRINYKRKKIGLGNARYMYVTEWISEDGECIRCHHHLVMDGELDMDTVESTWKCSKRVESRRIDYSEEHGLNGMATYMTKVMTVQRRGRKSQKTWNASKNLKRAVVKKNHYKFRKSKVQEMIRDRGKIEEYMQKQYPEYQYDHAEVRFNEINKMFYIYTRMRRRI